MHNNYIGQVFKGDIPFLWWPTQNLLGVINDHVLVREVNGKHKAEIRTDYHKGDICKKGIDDHELGLKPYTLVITGGPPRYLTEQRIVPGITRGWSFIETICEGEDQVKAIGMGGDAAKLLNIALYSETDRGNMIIWCPDEWEPVIG